MNDDDMLGVGALVLDLGTGETKLMAAQRFSSVQLDELVLHKYNINECCSEGCGHPLDAARMSPSFMACTSALRGGIDKLVASKNFQFIKWTHCFLGATAWYRTLDDEAKGRADEWLDALAANLNDKLVSVGINVLAEWGILSGKSEGLFETMAVEYAMRHCGLNLAVPTAVLAGGSGSVQLTGLDSLYSFPAELKAGIKVLTDGSRTHAENVKAWHSKVASALGEAPLMSALSTKARSLQDDGGHRIRLVMISAFYYLAAGQGIVKKDEAYHYTPAQVIDDKLRKFEEENDLLALANDANKQKAVAREMANAIRLRAILSELFGEHIGQVDILFARDWKLPTLRGEVDFRTTWTAGWWLDQLVGLYRLDTASK